MRSTIAFFMILLIATTGGAIAKSRELSPEMQQAVHIMMKLRMEAESALFKQMETVAASLAEVISQEGRYPEGEDAVIVAEELQVDLPEPGFYPQKGTGAFSRSKAPRVRLLVDRNFTRENVLKYIANASGTWQAEPGVITVVGNGSDVFIVWAAGSDKRPIIDPDTQKMRTIVKKLDLPND